MPRAARPKMIWMWCTGVEKKIRPADSCWKLFPQLKNKKKYLNDYCNIKHNK